MFNQVYIIAQISTFDQIFIFPKFQLKPKFLYLIQISMFHQNSILAEIFTFYQNRRKFPFLAKITSNFNQNVRISSKISTKNYDFLTKLRFLIKIPRTNQNLCF